MQEADWKRNAGASKLIQRHPVSLSRDKPHLIKSNVDFLKVPLGKETFYLTPDAILVTTGRAVAAFAYQDSNSRFEMLGSSRKRSHLPMPLWWTRPGAT